MKIFLHVLYTWLLANALLPVIWNVSAIITTRHGFKFFYFDQYILIILFSLLLVSLPSFLVILIFIKPIISLRFSNLEKLFLWSFATICIAGINVILPLLLVAGGFLITEELMELFVLPVLGAVFLSVIIRYKYFYNLNEIFSAGLVNQ
ncbi:MAG: hypothetical protein WDN26_18760 [Chitinophagaceae bacterium]